MYDVRVASQQLLGLAQSIGALQHGEFVLSSGSRSSWYFDARLLTLHSIAVYNIGTMFHGVVRGVSGELIGGPATGAIPIVTAAMMRVFRVEGTFQGFYVRSERKPYGTESIIEGSPVEGKRVVLVDDVVTTGNSLLRAAQVVEEAGGEVIYVAALADRSNGASSILQDKGYNYKPFWILNEEGVAVL